MGIYDGMNELERTRLVWERMVSRCTNGDDPLYNHYGGRGIGVCERWLDFDNFLEDMEYCPEDCTIERDDNDSGYDPGNCRWASWDRQRENTRGTRKWDNFWNRKS